MSLTGESALVRILRDYVVHILALLTCIIVYKVVDSIRPVVQCWDRWEFAILCVTFSTVVFAFQGVIALVSGISVWERAKLIYGLTAVVLVGGLLIASWPVQLFAFLCFWVGVVLLTRGKVAGYVFGSIVMGLVFWFLWKETLEALGGVIALLVVLNLLSLLEKRFPRSRSAGMRADSTFLE